ncbi:MAG: hypothetical protein AB4206_03665 [Xenococcaceae cyanobacterium]
MFAKLFMPLLAASAVIIAPSSVWAQVVQDQTNRNDQSIDNDNELGNTGVINQSATYNVGQSATYGFRGIVCPRPSFIISGSGNGNSFAGNSSNSYAVSGALVFPLGGTVGKNCKDLSTTLLEAEQFKLEEYKIKSAAETVKLCADMISAGIRVNAEEYPILAKKCSAVIISKGQSSRVLNDAQNYNRVSPLLLKENSNNKRLPINHNSKVIHKYHVPSNLPEQKRR